MKKISVIVFISLFLMAGCTVLEKVEVTQLTTPQISSAIDAYSDIEPKFSVTAKILIKNVYKQAKDYLDKKATKDDVLKEITKQNVSTIDLNENPDDKWMSYIFDTVRKLINENDTENLTKLLDKISEDIQFKSQPVSTLSPEIEITNAFISYDSIGTPEINVAIKLQNTTNDVDAFNVLVKCFNSYDEQIYGYSTDKYFKGICQENITPFEEHYFSWKLYGFDNTTNAEIAINKFHFKDGDTVNISDDNLKWIKANKQ